MWGILWLTIYSVDESAWGNRLLFRIRGLLPEQVTFGFLSCFICALYSWTKSLMSKTERKNQYFTLEIQQYIAITILFLNQTIMAYLEDHFVPQNVPIGIWNGRINGAKLIILLVTIVVSLFLFTYRYVQFCVQLRGSFELPQQSESKKVGICTLFILWSI